MRRDDEQEHEHRDEHEKVEEVEVVVADGVKRRVNVGVDDDDARAKDCTRAGAAGSRPKPLFRLKRGLREPGFAGNSMIVGGRQTFSGYPASSGCSR